MRVQPVQQHGHVQAIDVHRRLVGRLLALFVTRHLVDEAYLLQFIQRAVYQLDGHLTLFRDSFRCVGRLALGEPFGDERQDEDGDKFPVTIADVPRILVEAEIADVLRGIR